MDIEPGSGVLYPHCIGDLSHLHCQLQDSWWGRLDSKKVRPGALKSMLSPIILEWEPYGEIVAWVLFPPSGASKKRI